MGRFVNLSLYGKEVRALGSVKLAVKRRGTVVVPREARK